MRYELMITDGHASSDTCPLNKRMVLTQLQNLSVKLYKITMKNWILSHNMPSSMIINKYDRIICKSIEHNHLLNFHKIMLILTTVKYYCCVSVGSLTSGHFLAKSIEILCPFAISVKIAFKFSILNPCHTSGVLTALKTMQIAEVCAVQMPATLCNRLECHAAAFILNMLKTNATAWRCSACYTACCGNAVGSSRAPWAGCMNAVKTLCKFCSWSRHWQGFLIIKQMIIKCIKIYKESSIYYNKCKWLKFH